MGRPHDRVLFLIALAVVSAGCGANLQSMFEGDRHFEHCMALDARPEVMNAERRACWVGWVERSSYGQTRDRLAHADSRIAALAGP
ncbi:MAG: hypothetical protein FJ096_07370 [Deltaproteobacteria bacterium]|nr:hypothetical protein [Deltaproteobacteria bacterium]